MRSEKEVKDMLAKVEAEMAKYDEGDAGDELEALAEALTWVAFDVSDDRITDYFES